MENRKSSLFSTVTRLLAEIVSDRFSHRCNTCPVETEEIVGQFSNDLGELPNTLVPGHLARSVQQFCWYALTFAGGTFAVYHAPYVQVRKLAVIAAVPGTIGPVTVAAGAFHLASPANKGRIFFRVELEQGAVYFDELWVESAGGVEVDLAFAVEVHKAEHNIAAGVAPAPRAGWLEEQAEFAAIEPGVLEGRFGRHADCVEVVVAWLAPIALSRARLLAAVALEFLGGHHQLKLVLRMGGVGDMCLLSGILGSSHG